MTALRVLAVPTVAAAAFAFTAGCANERHQEIPASATMTVEGNKELSYTTPQDGHIYVYDVDEDRMVYQGIAEKGSTVRVDTDHDRVTVNGHTVAEKDAVDPGHQHKIFFMEQALPGTVVVPAGSRLEVERQPAPDTKIQIKESDQQPQTRIEVKDQNDPDTQVQIRTADENPDTHINVDSDDADTEIHVDH